jgi:hypothetical protein
MLSKMNKFLPSIKCIFVIKSKFNKTMDNSMTWHTKDTKIRNMIIRRINILMMNFQSIFGIATTTFMQKSFKCQFAVIIFAMNFYAFITTKSRFVFFSSMWLIFKLFFTVIAYFNQTIFTSAITMKTAFSTKLTFLRTKSRLILPIEISCIRFITNHANFFYSRFIYLFWKSMSALKATKLLLSTFKDISAFNTIRQFNSQLT